jgi:hypothetical protein
LKYLEKEVDSMSDKLSSVQSSVSSIASSLSLLGKEQSKSKDNWDPEGSHWSCDAITGTDDGFEHFADRGNSICRFCSASFYWDDDECFARQGKHLVSSHAFGTCSLGVSYHEKGEMIDHLVEFHRFDAGSSQHTDIGCFMLPNKKTLGIYKRRPEPHPTPAENNSNQALVIMPKLVKLLSPVVALAGGEFVSSRHKRRQLLASVHAGEQQTLGSIYSDWSEFDICRTLAAFDTRELAQGLQKSNFLPTCYKIGCLQEELVISGFEDTLREEAYMSSTQYEVSHLVLLNSTCRVSRRVLTGWVYSSAISARTMLPMTLPFDTIGDAMGLHLGSSLRTMKAINHFDKQSFMKTTQEIRKSLRRVPGAHAETVRDRSEYTSIEQLLTHDNSFKSKSTSRKTARRIDAWLLGIFIHSIPTRKILMSGAVVPSLASTDPPAFARLVIMNWAEVVRFGKLRPSSSIKAQQGAAKLQHACDEDLSDVDIDARSNDMTIEAGSGYHETGRSFELTYTDSNASMN